MYKRKKPGLKLLVIAGLLLYFVWLLFDQQKSIYSMTNERKVIETKIAEEKKLNADLKEQNEFANTDQFIESNAREKLGMVKQGEKVFIDSSR